MQSASPVGFSPADTVADPLTYRRAKGPPGVGAPLLCGCVRRCPTLPHPGGCSTIGAGGLSFRVRNGTGRFPSAMAAVTRVELCGRWCLVTLVPAVLQELHSGCVVCVFVVSPRPISTGQLHTLRCFHFRPINPVVWLGALTHDGVGDLILERASRLDAFSGYPFRTWLTSRAPGGTTGTPEVRPSRSSRTRDSLPQVSCARGG